MEYQTTSSSTHLPGYCNACLRSLHSRGSPPTSSSTSSPPSYSSPLLYSPLPSSHPSSSSLPTYASNMYLTSVNNLAGLLQPTRMHTVNMWRLSLEAGSHIIFNEALQFKAVSIQHMNAQKDGIKYEYLNISVKADPQSPITTLIIERAPDPNVRVTTPWKKAPAVDTVKVLPSTVTSRAADTLAPSNDPIQLRALTWDFADAPSLMALSKIMMHISTRRGVYNLLQHQCYWYARLIYTVMAASYPGYHEDIGPSSCRRSRFMLVFGGFSGEDVEVSRAYGQGYIDGLRTRSIPRHS